MQVRLTIAAGNAHAPDDPFGRETLVLGTDGTFRYRRERNGSVERSGRADPEHVRKQIEALRAAGYPETPPGDIMPGATLVSLRIDDGPEAYVDLFAVRGVPGYGPVVKSFESWCAWLRKGGDEAARPEGLLALDV